MPAWTRQAAEEFVSRLRPAATASGLSLRIVGSVANQGSSEHDLDLVAIPEHSRREDYDYEGLLENLQELGEVVNASDGEHEIDQLTLPDGRVVDMFFGQVDETRLHGPTPAFLSGARGAGGRGGAVGVLTHLWQPTPLRHGPALCGARPGSVVSEWVAQPGWPVTCKKCLAKAAQ